MILHNKTKKQIEPYFFIIPSIIIVVFVYLYPIVKVFQNSFYRISGGKKVFLGLGNYSYAIFEDSLFLSALLNNLKLLLGVPILIFISLVIASFLYQQIIGWKLFRIILLIPYILSITVVGIVFDYILRLDGVLNYILSVIHLNILANSWLGNPKIAMYSILGVVIWKEMGFGIILFLARMLSIDATIFEAAKIDGASWVKIFFINVRNMLSWMFNYVFVMTRGGPMNSTYVLEYYIYRLAIRFRQFGLASSLSVILFLLAVVFVILQFYIRSKALKEEELY
ncbi:MAG: carbohydrate ABC transporter permease [Promethearchaeota archaeon]